MPFHDITELPVGFCDPETVSTEALSVSDRVLITELLHRIYLCEDSRDCNALEKILTEDYINEHPLFGCHESARSFIQWLKDNPAGFDGIRHHCLNSITRKAGNDAAESVSYLLVTQLFPAASRNESPNEAMDAALPRIIGHGVVVDRWIRQNNQWYLQHRVYQQMSINSTFLPDSKKRQEVAQTP